MCACESSKRVLIKTKRCFLWNVEIFAVGLANPRMSPKSQPSPVKNRLWGTCGQLGPACSHLRFYAGIAVQLNGLWLRYCGLNGGTLHLDHEACHSECGYISLCLVSSLTSSSSSKPLFFGFECTRVKMGGKKTLCLLWTVMSAELDLFITCIPIFHI